MDFTYEELARLNTMMGIALMSGEVECDEISESVHKRITDEIVRRNQTEGKEVMKNVDSEKKMGITRKKN